MKIDYNTFVKLTGISLEKTLFGRDSKLLSEDFFLNLKLFFSNLDDHHVQCALILITDNKVFDEEFLNKSLILIRHPKLTVSMAAFNLVKSYYEHGHATENNLKLAEKLYSKWIKQ